MLTSAEQEFSISTEGAVTLLTRRAIFNLSLHVCLPVFHPAPLESSGAQNIVGTVSGSFSSGVRARPNRPLATFRAAIIPQGSTFMA
jgi:hypothetical protein